MCDSDDNVICGTMSNVFVVEGGVLATPPLERCGVAGVQRALVLELARARQVETRVSEISIDRLLAADELFVVNSVIGIWQIAMIGRRKWDPAPLTAKVRDWLSHAQDH